MVASIQIPKGYKHTEVGIIPEDWEVSTIAQKASVNTGSKNTQDRISDGIYPFFVRSQDVERINSYSFDGEAVLTAGDGVGTGKVFHYIVGKFDYHQRVYKISHFFDSLDGFYFYLYFQTHFYDRITSMTAKSSVDSVRMDMISKMPIPVPPTSEQKAIAQALFDISKLIENIEKLIAKKRAIKLATMQQLLTGKTRLSGFTKKWERKKLGDIGIFFKGNGIRRDEVKPQGLKCIRYGEIYTRYNNSTKNLISHILPETSKKATRISKGDLLFAGSGETSEEIGKCVTYLGSEDAFAGGDIIILRQTFNNSLYLGYLLNHKDIVDQKSNFGQGDAVVHISATNLAKVEILLPPREEQHAIAAVLYDMDIEISSLEKQVSKTKAIKQGMMQELLTGKIRLVHSEIKAESRSAESKKHNWAIDEAIIISALVNKFGTEQYPLGRKRYTKMSYLFHRHIDGNAEGYLKMAAGPYNPKTKYGGVETIARKNGYIKDHKSGPLTGFISSDNTQQALDYFNKWYGEDALQWLEQFRYEKNDVLELWATVDMAVQDLQKAQKDITVKNVKTVIQNNKEWKPKLKREIFSDENIAEAISKTQQLFAEGQA